MTLYLYVLYWYNLSNSKIEILQLLLLVGSWASS